MIVVAGEALVDLVPHDGRLAPLPGGSPFNVAIALARLGAPTGFLGRCSTDAFGRLLVRRLDAAGVDLGLVATTDEPTTLAVVQLDDDGQASYGFYVEATSAAGLSTDEVRLGDGDPLHVSFGAVTLHTEPAGGALRSLIHREARRRVVCLDPNVRPAVIGDPHAYVRELEGLLASCALVRVSEEDLAVLAPGRSASDVVQAWARAGPELVVLTRGGQGALAVTASGTVREVPAPDVEVVDTVGAGDAFTAGLLAQLDAAGRLGVRTALATVTDAELDDALTAATRVAALACTRQGADPPRRHEL